MTIPIFFKIVLSIVFLGAYSINPVGSKYQSVAKAQTIQAKTLSMRLISSHEISLEKRYPNSFVNDVFKDNILLNIAYMESKIDKASKINWDEVGQPFHYELDLKPSEIFAYHDSVLPQYQGKVAKTTNAHFNSQEKFKSSGYLFGDGVCHLASLLYWVAKDAKLDTLAPTNHNFMTIPQVPKEFGVSIYNYPGKNSESARQNLYITNNKDLPVVFSFDYDGKNLKISVFEETGGPISKLARLINFGKRQKSLPYSF